MINDVMSWQDAVNGAFELVTGALVWFNVRQMYHDKRVTGVHLVPTTVFVTWSYWNLYFYPHLNQWLSFAGGLVMMTLNTIWLIQMIYYTTYPEGRPSDVS